MDPTDPMGSDGMGSDANVRAAERIADAPLPTRTTLRRRQNLLIQFWRFTRINLKMMRIIMNGHG
jgi:hypothetical protein